MATLRMTSKYLKNQESAKLEQGTNALGSVPSHPQASEYFAYYPITLQIYK
jgi:hypothetical protein